MAYWSYSCGRKAVSRVRVYARSVSPALYVEWTWGGERHQRSLRTVTGHPVTDRKVAQQIAHEMSRNLEHDHNRAAHASVFGGSSMEKRLAELLARVHAIRGRTWSQQHSRTQETLRRYWLDRLGDVPLDSITEAMVEAVTAEDAEALHWSPRTVGRRRQYLAECMGFAALKLKWLDPRNQLTALDIPKPGGESRPYSMDEVRRLLPALEAVDLRAGWIGHVAWQSGRRLAALRTFPTAGVDPREDHTVLRFPGATDKARQTGEVVVVGRAHELTAALLSTAGEHLLGDPPPSHELAIKVWLRAAEGLAEIPHIQGRAFHGLKRRYATESHGLRGRDKQAGTLTSTLDRRYVQDDLAPKRQVAETLAKMLDRGSA